MNVAVMMMILPRMVSIIAEGIVPITMAIVQYMRERFKDREIYVAVDCAVLFGSSGCDGFNHHPVPAVCAACRNFAWCANAAHRHPGCFPFWAGAVVPYTKGNVVKTVIVLLFMPIPFMYFSNTDLHSYTAGLQDDGSVWRSNWSGTEIGQLGHGR